MPRFGQHALLAATQARWQSVTLPIPFTNMVPAVTVILFAASMIGKDGYVFLAAIVMFIVTIAFFGAIGVGGVSAVKWAYDWLA